MFNALSDAINSGGLNLKQGTVKSVDDPKNIGRIQVSIPGYLDQGDLPWVGVMRNSIFGIGPSFGTYGSPAEGSEVVVHFQNNDIHHGICLGSLITSANGTSGFGPSDWGFKDPAGNVFKVSNGSITFTSASGTSFTIDSSGNLKIQATKIFLN